MEHERNADPGELTLTAPSFGSKPDATERAPGRPRLPAPLQFLDPERYELVAEHGRGGLGRVFHARDRELGRSVAIKELLAPTKTSELRVFREALITARLEHRASSRSTRPAAGPTALRSTR